MIKTVTMRLLIVFLCLLAACTKQEIQKQEIYPAEVMPYVQMFKDEAIARGVSLHFDGLHVYLQDSIPPAILDNGMLSPETEAYYKPNEHAIYIRTTGYNWREMPAELICHELGHAILKRGHDFTHLPDGSQKSLMGCPCSNTKNGWTEPGRQGMRAYYFDELFNPLTPSPF